MGAFGGDNTLWWWAVVVVGGGSDKGALYRLREPSRAKGALPK